MASASAPPLTPLHALPNPIRTPQTSPPPSPPSPTKSSALLPSNEADISSQFSAYYMRLATTEFADDLNSIRAAGDFDDAAVPVLVRALRQGASIFSAEEKRRVLAAASAASAAASASDATTSVAGAGAAAAAATGAGT
ncbi:MAG: hypothetical protein M1819_001160 [Sarea resinae]|nr:MAG: hypothetical protein M1819_001160 [Sarea resinae]